MSVRTISLAEDGLYELSYAWRYHPGDDPRWADPAFDDRGWERVEPLLSPGKLPSGRWPGTGWFRRHVRIDPGLYGKTVTIRVATPGATTVFLDGAPVMSTAMEAGGKTAGGVWREVVLSPRPDHVLAVRHSLTPAVLPAESGDLGFLLSIQPRNAAAFQQTKERRQTTLLVLLTAVPAFLAAFLALLHLALFLSYRKARENLFYALGMAASSSVAICDLVGAWIPSESGQLLAIRLVFFSVLALIFFILLTYYAVRTRTFPRSWIAFAAGGVALAALTFLHPHPPPWIWYVYFGLAVIEVIRVEATGETVEREGVKILLRGFMILAAVIMLQVLISLGVVPPIAGLGNVYQFGLLAFEMAMSLFLARGFARTSLHLERRLAPRPACLPATSSSGCSPRWPSP